MPRVGRPKSKNPKCERFTMRVTKDEYTMLCKLSEDMGMSIRDTIMRSVSLLREETYKSKASLLYLPPKEMIKLTDRIVNTICLRFVEIAEKLTEKYEWPYYIEYRYGDNDPILYYNSGYRILYYQEWLWGSIFPAIYRNDCVNWEDYEAVIDDVIYSILDFSPDLFIKLKKELDINNLKEDLDDE